MPYATASLYSSFPPSGPAYDSSACLIKDPERLWARAQLWTMLC